MLKQSIKKQTDSPFSKISKSPSELKWPDYMKEESRLFSKNWMFQKKNTLQVWRHIRKIPKLSRMSMKSSV